jgi:large subunit ribosomal protein L31
MLTTDPFRCNRAGLTLGRDPQTLFEAKMKADIHPDYRLVAFHDVSCDETFITGSCATAKGEVTIDGVEYPLIKIDISAKSHPFYTGTQKIMDTAGRVERFYSRYGLKRPEEEEEA